MMKLRRGMSCSQRGLADAKGRIDTITLPITHGRLRGWTGKYPNITSITDLWISLYTRHGRSTWTWRWVGGTGWKEAGNVRFLHEV